MQMTEAQRVTLKAFVQADATLGPKAAAGDYDGVAGGLNAAAAPAYYGIRTDAPVADIRNAILWPRYTPAPAITSANAAQHTACSNACMAKQGVLGLLIPAAGTTFDATKATQTNGLKDATTALPSAAGFNNQDAGWTGAAACVANVLVRPMTVAEKVFATAGAVPALADGASARGVWNAATGAGNPDTFGPQGRVEAGDIGGILA